MAKYRKRPTVIEAEQIICEPWEKDWGSGVTVALSPRLAAGVCMKKDARPITPGHVHTASGPVQLKCGDWIAVQTVNGKDDYWPIAADIFAASYERVSMTDEEVERAAELYGIGR